MQKLENVEDFEDENEDAIHVETEKPTELTNNILQKIANHMTVDDVRNLAMSQLDMKDHEVQKFLDTRHDARSVSYEILKYWTLGQPSRQEALKSLLSMLRDFATENPVFDRQVFYEIFREDLWEME